ncbi:hypothetical protein [Mycolicibacter kumamotonensis]|uniref:Uncharacterized protein n=1 Tax=Mycolicibacter kumamotonensis TaxID=354243 RepID=A0A1B8SL66_9MYCO|nr:hypothetical protein [Mycolicibacter kumamotonensis]OBY33444.1 hypothetical protein ACT18_00385 [Mycolicibacter kumamotonensis]
MITILAALWLQHAPFNTCGDGNVYDPAHGACAPYYPANPQPGYPGYGPHDNCGFYDPLHGVCQPYPPAIVPPFYGS